MINLDDITNEKNTIKMAIYSRSPVQSLLIIGGSESRKTNALLNLINEQNHIDKIFLYVKDLGEPKYEFLRKKVQKCRNNAFKWSKCIYWVFKYDGRRLWEYRWLDSKQKIKINCVWWHDCRHYEK